MAIKLKVQPPPRVTAKVKPGIPGTAATIEVGTVTTLAAGASATVENSGTENAAVLDFGIPEGQPGADGNLLTPFSVTGDGTPGPYTLPVSGTNAIVFVAGVGQDPENDFSVAGTELLFGGNIPNGVAVFGFVIS
jgi:hypothetical protein